MGLEDLTGSNKYINDLDDTNPSGTSDAISEGDNHLRGIKNVLLNSFPNITGGMKAKHVWLNNIANLQSPPVKSTNYTVVVDDHGKIIQVDSGVTITLEDAATLGAGWRVVIFNSGSSTVTLSTKTSGDKIRGGNSYSLDPGEAVGLVVDSAEGEFLIISEGLETAPSFDKVNLNNNEQGDHNTDGDVYFDSSSGLYVKAQNTPGDQAGGNLCWTSGNFTAGNGLNVSYDGEDHPTLSIPSGGVGAAEIASGAVGQGELKTTTGEVTASTSGATVSRQTLPGGQYGFWPETSADNGASIEFYAYWSVGRADNAATSNFSPESWTYLSEPSYGAYITLHLGASSSNTVTIKARQRYVQASPPYDLGDGECGLFVTLDVASNGFIAGASVAPDPTWANNGPTDIRPDYIDSKTGKKYKRVKRSTVTQSDVEAGRADVQDLIAAKKEAPIEEVEITPDFKNADMNLFPHSWVSPPQGTICMLDPVETHDLLFLHEEGEDIADLLHRGFILPGDDVSRYGPPGVKMISFKWKKSKK